MELRATPDRDRSSAEHPDRHYVQLSFRAPLLESENRREPINVAFVLDRSGSMSGEKIATARRAVDLSLRMLRPDDRFSLVVFDGEIDTIAGPTLATDDARLDALRALERVGPRGSTDLEGGWSRGCRHLADHVIGSGVNRAVLVTDGQANLGICQPAELAALAANWRGRGITTTTFGIGRDFNEFLLQAMSDAGGGQFYYVASAQQLVDMLSGELGETLRIVVKDPVVEIVVPAGVAVRLLDRHEMTQGERGHEVRLPDLTSGQLVDLTFEVTLPPGDVGAALAMAFTLRSGAERVAVATADVRWRYVTAAEAARAARDPEVGLRAARMITDHGRAEALRLGHEGRFAESAQQVRMTARSLEELARHDPRIRDMRERLEAEQDELASEMDVSARKSRMWMAHAALRGRTASGKARRTPEDPA